MNCICSRKFLFTFTFSNSSPASVREYTFLMGPISLLICSILKKPFFFNLDKIGYTVPDCAFHVPAKCIFKLLIKSYPESFLLLKILSIIVNSRGVSLFFFILSNNSSFILDLKSYISSSRSRNIPNHILTISINLFLFVFSSFFLILFL